MRRQNIHFSFLAGCSRLLHIPIWDTTKRTAWELTRNSTQDAGKYKLQLSVLISHYFTLSQCLIHSLNKALFCSSFALLSRYTLQLYKEQWIIITIIFWVSELKTKRAERKFVQCITVIKLQLNVIRLGFQLVRTVHSVQVLYVSAGSSYLAAAKPMNKLMKTSCIVPVYRMAMSQLYNYFAYFHNFQY